MEEVFYLMFGYIQIFWFLKIYENLFQRKNKNKRQVALSGL